MKKIWRFGLYLALATLVLAGCAGTAEQLEVQRVAASEDSASFAEDIAGEAAPMTIAQTSNMAADVELPAQPMIIRTGSISIIVASTEETMSSISGLASGMEGWVVSSNLYQYGQANRGNITVRVPVAQFDAAMAQIKALALEVNSESSSGQDVTEEYVDLTARLTNLEATAARVRGFLDEAKDVEDALAVNQELSSLEAQIEQIKGRMKYLSQSAAFSTIEVEITPDILSRPIEIVGWRPQGVAKEAVEDLVEFLQDLADFLIRFVIYALPQLLILGVPAFFIIRAIIRAIRKRRQPAPPSPEN